MAEQVEFTRLISPGAIEQGGIKNFLLKRVITSLGLSFLI